MRRPVIGPGTIEQRFAALSLNGSTQYVSCGANLDGYDWRTQAFSVSLWYRSAGGSPPTWQNFVGNELTTGANTGWALVLRNTGQLYWQHMQNYPSRAFQIVVPDTDLLDGAWHHLVATRPGANTNSGYRIMIDCIEQSWSSAVNAAHDGVSTAGTDVEVGSRNAGTFKVSGELADVRVYTRELGTDEVRRICDGGGADGVTNGLAARWITTDGVPGAAVTSLRDIGPNGYDGSPVGSPVYAGASLPVRMVP